MCISRLRESHRMKLVLLSLALVGCVAADSAPYRPKGALLVLPQQLDPPAQQVQQDESLDKVSEKVMERLRQEQGSQTGNYHVYLADGRLQKVQYTAAPLRSSQNAQTASSFNAFQFQPQQNGQSANTYSRFSEERSSAQSEGSSNSQGSEPNPVVAHFGRLQQERLQQELQQLQQQQEQLRQQTENVQQQLQQQKEFASNYVATVHFSDVPPIPAPIYSQSPSPITRILRQAV